MAFGLLPRKLRRKYRIAAASCRADLCYPFRTEAREVLAVKRREFITLLGGAVAWSSAARAQQGARMQRIGVLMGYPEGDRQAQANVTALRQGLETLGWIEGRNVQIDYRWAGADPDKARAFARELVGLASDVIVPSTNQVTRIVQQETRTIPVVFAFVGDPVGSGFGDKADKICSMRVLFAHSVISGPIFAVMHNAALDPANLTTGMSQGACSRSSTKVMVNGWPARVFPSASVNGKDAHRLSVCATAMRYDERCVSDASLD
jgi:ABC transporter substrate binding protein